MDRKILLLLLCGTMLVSCRVFQHEKAADVVAVVGNSYLTLDELNNVTMQATSSEDSARMADEYIRAWAEEALFYRKATASVVPELERMVEDYRKQLYVGYYEDRLVAQKMDQTLPADSIHAFYLQHSSRFVLETGIVKGLLLIVPNGAPNMDKLLRWVQKPETEIEKIEKYAYQYATGYQLFLDQWATINQLRLQMPISQQDLSSAIRQEKQIMVQDSLQTYILQVTDKCLAGETMPEVYAEPEIRRIMLAERQVAFLKEQKTKLYNEWK